MILSLVGTVQSFLSYSSMVHLVLELDGLLKFPITIQDRLWRTFEDSLKERIVDQW